jgi:hypothetical protein
MNAIEQEEQELINKLNEIKIKKQIYEQINKNKQLIKDLTEENEKLINKLQEDLIKKTTAKFEKLNEPKPEIKNEINPEPKPEIKGNMLNIKNAKLLSRAEMDKLTFDYLSKEVNIETIKEGDYIKVYTGKGWGGQTYYAKVSRISDKTIFYKICRMANENKIHYYEWKPQGTWIERSYTYYFIDTELNNLFEEKEMKILKKSYPQISKAECNFLIMDEMDYGR